MRSNRHLCGLTCLVVAIAWTNPAQAQEIEVHGPGGSVHVNGPGGAVHVNAPGGQIGVDYYTPQYYLNYPVFYDGRGVPFYYVGGVRRYVPRTYVRYHGLVGHYRAHRRNYHRWYRGRGHRYHGYRRAVHAGGAYNPLYHDGYAVYYDPTGQPYYWIDGRRSFIPRHHPRYRVYRTHYGRHAPRYRVWQRRHGTRYRTYRRPGYRRAAPVRVRHRPAAPVHRGRAHPGRRYGAPHQPAVRSGRRGVDCSRNPGHPSCRHQRAQQRQQQRRYDRKQGRQHRRDSRRDNRRRHR